MLRSLGDVQEISHYGKSHLCFLFELLYQLFELVKMVPDLVTFAK